MMLGFLVAAQRSEGELGNPINTRAQRTVNDRLNMKSTLARLAGEINLISCLRVFRHWDGVSLWVRGETLLAGIHALLNRRFKLGMKLIEGTIAENTDYVAMLSFLG